MYSVPHLISTKGNNKGSCRKYAEYLLKDNSFFFNHSSDSIDLEEGVLLIDENSKRGLGKEDAKWFAPVYALSEEESQFIAYQLFGREVENFSDLTEQEQKKYNEYVVMLGKGFQDEMAKNFNKEDLGIRTGKDLFYIGVVENKRNYTHQDEEVLMGLKKREEEKGGFNTHIHIIQSRLANNGKYSKISPMSNERKVRTNNLGGKVGFDRNYFKNRMEQYFDRITKYVRNIEETFEYQKAKKKGKDLTDFKVKELKIEEVPTEKKEEEPLTVKTKKPIKKKKYSQLSEEDKDKNKEMLKILREKIIQSRERPVVRRKYIPKKEADRIIRNANIVEYFLYLEKIGLVQKQYEKGRDTFYKNLRGDLISVSELGYRNYTAKTGGQIMKAIQEMQNLSWIEALYKIIELNKEEVAVPEIKTKKSFELLQEYETQKGYLRRPYEELGISVFYTDRYLSAFKMNRNGKEFTTLGIKNQSGGYYTYNAKYNTFSKVGKGDISVIPGSDKEKSKDVVIFSNYMEYMAYMQVNKMANLKETAIILNDRENTEKLTEYLKNVKGKVYSFADNFTLDRLSDMNIVYKDMREAHGLKNTTFLEQLKKKNLQEEENNVKGLKI